MEMNQTRLQKEANWIIMRWGMPEDYKHPKPDYFNRCIDKIADRERGDYQRLNKDEEEKARQDRQDIITALLMEGKTSQQAFDVMFKADQLNFRGKTISYGRFRSLCTKARSESVMQKVETIKTRVIRYLAEGLSNEEVIAKMGITNKQFYRTKTLLNKGK